MSKVCWIHTRKTENVLDNASSINITSKHLLNDILHTDSLPFEEIRKSQLVIFEIPPLADVVTSAKVAKVIGLMSKDRQPFAMIVLPSLRRRSNKALWVHKWNRDNMAPCRFMQVCSCKVGADPTLHIPYYVACSETLSFAPCAEVPSGTVSVPCASSALKKLVQSIVTCVCGELRSTTMVCGNCC